jgi:YVTN family beta-propeller protein
MNPRTILSTRLLRVVAITAVVATSIGCGDPPALNRADLLVASNDISLPGSTSRFDYQSLDATNHTLWIAHLGDSAIIAVDVNTMTVTATVGDIASVHGVLAVADHGRVYATATGTNEVVAIDTATHKVTARVATGRFPDGLAYAPHDDLILVTNKADGTVSVHNADTLELVRTIDIAGETGNVAYDTTTKYGYVAGLPPNSLTQFDPATGTIADTIDLPGCEGAHGVLIDPSTQRAYVACEDNARMLTIDLTARRLLATSNVGSGPDVLAFDPQSQRLYLAAESGDVAIFDTSTPEPRLLRQQNISNDAHSVAVDPNTHHVYFPLANANGAPVLRITTLSDTSPLPG